MVVEEENAAKTLGLQDFDLLVVGLRSKDDVRDLDLVRELVASDGIDKTKGHGVIMVERGIRPGYLSSCQVLVVSRA